MQTAEVSNGFEQFKSEVADLEGDALLDKWIEFDGSAISKEPDMGLLMNLVLEATLAKTFGVMEWHEKVEERRKAKQDANRT